MPQIKGLKIEEPNGTIWQGELQNVQWQKENFGYVSWNFKPMRLLQAKADFEVRFGRGSDMKLMGNGHIGAGIVGLYAENVVASLPADEVRQRIAMPVPVTVAGNVELSVKEWIYSQPWCQTAIGTLVWSNSKILSPLGELEPETLISDWSCEDNQLVIQGDHNNSQIAAELNAELQKNGHYKVDAWFKPNAEFPDAMKAQLQWLGDPNRNGEYPFSYSGKIKLP